ncbi:MAG: chemotaxis protein CheB [Lachnospiraceae bacterium]|nr:chemotaxis protein CheB [Lachnospiraceae bacterium]
MLRMDLERNNMPFKNNDVSLNNRIIAIGASTGGTDAILEVLKGLGRDIPGIVMVQHMPEGFTGLFAKRLDDQCVFEVREAVNGDRVTPGLALLAPGGDCQMRIRKDSHGFVVEIKEDERVNGHRPSVGALFDSVANEAGDQAIGVILTGMGSDGARELLKMRQRGALTIGQDEDSCIVYGMPRVAYEVGAVQYQLSLKDIPGKIMSSI